MLIGLQLFRSIFPASKGSLPLISIIRCRPQQEHCQQQQALQKRQQYVMQDVRQVAQSCCDTKGRKLCTYHGSQQW